MAKKKEAAKAESKKTPKQKVVKSVKTIGNTMTLTYEDGTTEEFILNGPITHNPTGASKAQVDEDEDDEDEDEDNEDNEDDDDEDDEDDDEDNEDDDDEDEPKGKKGKPAPAKGKGKKK